MLYCASFEKGHFRGVYDLKMNFENCAQYNIFILFIFRIKYMLKKLTKKYHKLVDTQKAKTFYL